LNPRIDIDIIHISTVSSRDLAYNFLLEEINYCNRKPFQIV
jgi:hypothetical protein